MNHPNNRLVRERGPVCVAWVCLGEGYNGEYDPRDPEDKLLLRFDVAVRNEDTGSFVTVESRCTCFAEKASVKDKEAALDILLDRFYDAYTAEPRQCMSMLADELSYISADTYRSLVCGTDQTAPVAALK